MPPELAQPIPDEVLYLYLEVFKEAVSVVLITKKDSNQNPIYLISKALVVLETHYQKIEKITLTLVTASRKSASIFIDESSNS